jgi:hypothetical protein
MPSLEEVQQMQVDLQKKAMVQMAQEKAAQEQAQQSQLQMQMQIQAAKEQGQQEP